MRGNSIIEFNGIIMKFFKCIVFIVLIFLVMYSHNIMPVHAAGITFPDGQVFDIGSNNDSETSIKINGKLINSGTWKAINGDAVLVGEKGIMIDPRFGSNNIKVYVESIRKKIGTEGYEILGYKASYKFKDSYLGSTATINGVVSTIEKQNGIIGLKIEGTNYFTNQYISKIEQKNENNKIMLNIYDINHNLINKVKKQNNN